MPVRPVTATETGFQATYAVNCANNEGTYTLWESGIGDDMFVSEIQLMTFDYYKRRFSWIRVALQKFAPFRSVTTFLLQRPVYYLERGGSTSEFRYRLERRD